jgi:putative CocE/NonD family hydrolase
MRDGTGLYADLYLPPRAGAYPTILVRTSYDKREVKAQEDIDPGLFTEKGYAVVSQDVRGRYRSEGTYYHGIYEADDGYDTIEWIARQPWSDGKVGMTGKSYLAAVQCAAAIARPPHLASLFHVKAPASYYQDSDRCGGAFRLHMFTVILFFAATATDMAARPSLAASLQQMYRDSPDLLKHWPVRRGSTQLSATPDLEKWLFDLMDCQDYDDRWKSVPLWEPALFFERYADVPGFYLGGWYDMYRENLFFSGLSARKEGPIRLVMGPWTHKDLGRVSGDVDFGADAAMTFDDYNDLQLRWFDRTLKGAGAGVPGRGPVRIFVMGGGGGSMTKEGRMFHGGRWRDEREWPLARTVYTRYYLHEGGTLSTGAPLVPDSCSRYVYDPRDPLPTVGGTAYLSRMSAGPVPRETWEVKQELIVPYGACDQRESTLYFNCSSNSPLSSRPDNLVFQTDPLQRTVEVTGPISVKLWASSTAVDTDFTAKLIDVYPPTRDYREGYAMNIVDRILRARYRNGFEKPEFMRPGEVYELVIVLPETSNLFDLGHRIRLDISSSNFPQFDANPNTGDARAAPDDGRFVIAENSVFHDALRPSHALLPVIPV